MSEKLFDKLGTLNRVLKSQSWLTGPIYYLIDRTVPTETREDLGWQDEADLAILEQAPPLKHSRLCFPESIFLPVA